MTLRTFVTLLRLDATLAVRHRLVLVVFVVATILGLLVGWVLPESLVIEPAMTVSVEPVPVAHEVMILRPGLERPPFNLSILPVLLAVDVVFLGFMFGAVMVLQDKQFGVTRLFRVGPGTVGGYIGSKLIINLGLVALNVVLLVGLGDLSLFLHRELYPRVLSCAGGMTLLGIGMGALFRQLSTFFYPMAGVGLLAALPTFLYLERTELAAAWWLPTYHVLFGADAVFFGGDARVVHTAIGLCLAFAALAAVFAAWMVSNYVMKEAV
jgi:hypothetical protein